MCIVIIEILRKSQYSVIVIRLDILAYIIEVVEHLYATFNHRPLISGVPVARILVARDHHELRAPIHEASLVLHEEWVSIDDALELLRREPGVVELVEDDHAFSPVSIVPVGTSDI